MIWWKGRGLWMGLLIALFIVSAQRSLGEIGVPIGCIASATMIFFMRNWLDEEESSLFSIPTRFWWPALLGLSIVLFIKR